MLVAEFGQSVYYHPEVATAIRSGMQRKTARGPVPWAPRTHKQHYHHDDRRRSGESCRVSTDER